MIDDLSSISEEERCLFRPFTRESLAIIEGRIAEEVRRFKELERKRAEGDAVSTNNVIRHPSPTPPHPPRKHPTYVVFVSPLLTKHTLHIITNVWIFCDIFQYQCDLVPFRIFRSVWQTKKPTIYSLFSLCKLSLRLSSFYNSIVFMFICVIDAWYILMWMLKARLIAPNAH